MAKKTICIVVPVYNEAKNLPVLCERVRSVFEKKLDKYEHEILFVDDGSRDNSWDIIQELSKSDTKVSGLRLSRNFGKELALTAGVESIESADAVIFIDADLQHPPARIPDFITEWEKGADIVVGIRKDVADYSFLKKIGSKLFYMMLSRCSDIEIPPNSTDFRLLDKKVMETLCRFSERTRMFRGLIDWLGFNKSFIKFSAPRRFDEGKPTYSYKKLAGLAVNSITSFSLLPLRITGYLGMAVIFFSGILLAYMVMTDFLNFVIYTPQAYFAVFNTFLVGVVLSGLGLIALYIGHIHTEVVGRPLYIVRERIKK